VRFRSSCVWLTCAAIAAAAVVGAESPAPKVLTWVYNCQPGGSFGAAFVVGGEAATLWFPGQPAIPLTQLMSASGARYGDKTYELFIKGMGGFLEKGGAKIADNCQAVRPRILAPVGQGTLTDADAGKAVQLKVGQKVQFSLPVQSGTGYSWQASLKSPDLDLEFGKESAVPQPGGPATQLITAKASHSGFLVLEFQYARPWEKGTTPAKTVRFPILIIE
jgi:predicted secreted protein/membrane-bound inhibitor of C-type lysozyme